MPEEIDAATFSQKPGEIGAVVRSPFGYHIFKIIEKEARAKKGWDAIIRTGSCGLEKKERGRGVCAVACKSKIEGNNKD